MLRTKNTHAGLLEFARFRKQDHISDEALIEAVLDLEQQFFAHQDDVYFHCLVRNFAGEYANLLLASSHEAHKAIQAAAFGHSAAQHFFSMLDMANTHMHLLDISAAKFDVPSSFSCVEFGSFQLQPTATRALLQQCNEDLETQYLAKFKNTKGHLLTAMDNETFAELTFGESWGQTRQICFGYDKDTHGQAFLSLLHPDSFNLDFWYVVA